MGSYVVTRAILLAIVVFTAGCGNAGPTQPSLPSARLDSGTYRLTVTMSTSGTTVCETDVCPAVSLCLVPAGVLQPIAIAAPVEVLIERTGDTIVVRADQQPSSTFRMDLRVSGNSISGSAAGHYRTGGIEVSIGGGAPQRMATVIGTLTSVVAGTIDGAISVGGSGCSNAGHRWSLDARLR